MAKESVNDDAKEMEGMLAVVVKRRKTFPVKCMDYCKKIIDLELSRLENATFTYGKNITRDDFKRILQRTKKSKYVRFSPVDLKEAEKKLLKLYNTAKNINRHLEKSNKVQTNNVENFSSV